MNEEEFAIKVAEKYRQVFNEDYLCSASRNNRDGSARNDFISPQKLVRTLSAAHAVLIALDFLGVCEKRYNCDQAIIFLYLYKKIVFRSERRRQACSSAEELAQIMSSHENDLALLRATVEEWKSRKELIPSLASMHWLTSVSLFFQQDDKFNGKKVLHGKDD